MRNLRVGPARRSWCWPRWRWSATAFAQAKMPKLPKPYTFAQTGDSPGKVTFNHESHVDETRRAARPATRRCSGF